jgi:hypothetical protein
VTASEKTEACSAITKKGTPCSIEVQENGLCHVHNPNGTYRKQHPVRCSAKTDEGRKCPHVAQESGVCHVHNQATTSEEPEGLSEGESQCSAITKKGARCPHTVQGNGFCHVHNPDGKYRQQHPVKKQKAKKEASRNKKRKTGQKGGLLKRAERDLARNKAAIESTRRGTAGSKPSDYRVGGSPSNPRIR